jgi:hypothetical protein
MSFRAGAFEAVADASRFGVERGSCCGVLLNENVVDKAVAPALSTLERPYDGMPFGAGVLARMLVRRRVAAADVAASQTEPEGDPAAAGLEALLATIGRVRLG